MWLSLWSLQLQVQCFFWTINLLCFLLFFFLCWKIHCIRATTESRVLLVNSVNSPIKKYSDFTHTDLFQIVVLGIQMICSHLLYVLVAIFILIVQPWYTCYDMFSCHLIISDENHSYPPVGGGFIYPRMYFVFEHQINYKTLSPIIAMHLSSDSNCTSFPCKSKVEGENIIASYLSLEG